MLAFVAVLAACGGAHRAGTRDRPPCPSRAAALVHLRRDVTELRRAADLPTKDSLKGNPSINKATDRFLLDVETAPIDLLTANRMIDYAAAALVGSCEQCFQALEAARPILAVAHSGAGEPCGRP